MSETTERSGGAGERSDHILLFAGDQSLQRPSEMGISTAGEYTNPRYQRFCLYWEFCVLTSGGDTCLEGSLEGLVTGDEEYVAGPRKEGLPDSMQVQEASARRGYLIPCRLCLSKGDVMRCFLMTVPELDTSQFLMQKILAEAFRFWTQPLCGSMMLELLKMDAKSLGEEYESFLSDKAGELEYLQSLEQQIKKLEDVTHTVNCICGSEYRVAMGLCA
ncbi:unnamed protein product [Linum tenue]|uniref:Uncharacterized protein n=1 Tax=Linum tenue TaxID=586396 RepID=A0AAV0RFN9_9ROSI|nr:unnamed protein product [Linum tenue]